MSHGRPTRKPRWQPTADTMIIARHKAAKPLAEDMATVTDILAKAFDALRAGVVTELQFSILRGSIDTARMIERQGVVKGLTRTIDEAAVALDDIWSRITQGGGWGRTSLHHYELGTMAEFVTLHAWACRQLSRAEYLCAIESARGFVGHTALVIYGSQAKEATA